MATLSKRDCTSNGVDGGDEEDEHGGEVQVPAQDTVNEQRPSVQLPLWIMSRYRVYLSTELSIL